MLSILLNNCNKSIFSFKFRVTKSLPIQNFEIEKHKIFEKLSEYKNKIDDLTRKNQQFTDFRKNFYEAN